MTTMTKMQLFEKLEQAKARQQSLEMALGRVRSDIMNLNFPGSHRETIDNVMKIVDNAIKNA
mgnify:CR=1 FL=1